MAKASEAVASHVGQQANGEGTSFLDVGQVAALGVSIVVDIIFVVEKEEWHVHLCLRNALEPSPAKSSTSYADLTIDRRELRRTLSARSVQRARAYLRRATRALSRYHRLNTSEAWALDLVWILGLVAVAIAIGTFLVMRDKGDE